MVRHVGRSVTRIRGAFTNGLHPLAGPWFATPALYQSRSPPPPFQSFFLFYLFRLCSFSHPTFYGTPAPIAGKRQLERSVPPAKTSWHGESSRAGWSSSRAFDIVVYQVQRFRDELEQRGTYADLQIHQGTTPAGNVSARAARQLRACRPRAGTRRRSSLLAPRSAAARSRGRDQSHVPLS